jgi:hypothetical protein
MLYKLQLIHPRLSSCSSPQVSAFFSSHRSLHVRPCLFLSSVLRRLRIRRTNPRDSPIPLSGFLLRTLRTRGIWIEAGFFVLCGCVVCSRLGVLVGICVDLLTILLGVLLGFVGAVFACPLAGSERAWGEVRLHDVGGCRGEESVYGAMKL